MRRETVTLNELGKVNRYHFTRRIILEALKRLYRSISFEVYYQAIWATEHLRGQYIDEVGTEGAALIIDEAKRIEKEYSNAD